MATELRNRIWNWLPTFLAIAEAGGISAASRELHVTPAAVSRTLRLLEAELGEVLFNRVGRTLVLNDRGARLRASMREATHTVDRGIARSLKSAFAGPLRVASLGVLTDHFVIATLLDLKRAYPALLPQHQNLGSAASVADVAAGALDVAFYYEELTAEGVEVRKIASTTMSVYCGEGHPLFVGAEPGRSEILGHAFSVPQVGDAGRVLDGWPIELAREIGMRITTLRSNLEVCRSGLMLCVLPDITAFESLCEGALRRLDQVPLPDIPIYAARAIGGLRGGAGDALTEGTVTRIEAFNRAFGARMDGC